MSNRAGGLLIVVLAVLGALPGAAHAASDLDADLNGQSRSYAPGETVDVSSLIVNRGPDATTNARLTIALDGLLFGSMAVPTGWSCTVPAVGATGSISCTKASLEASAGQNAGFFSPRLRVPVDAAPGSTYVLEAGATADGSDPVPSNNSATYTLVTEQRAAVAVTLLAGDGPVAAGTDLPVTVRTRNFGPNTADDVVVTLEDPGPGVSLASVTPPAGWTCTQVTPPAETVLRCSPDSGSLSVEDNQQDVAVVLRTDPVADPRKLSLVARAASSTADTIPDDDVATLERALQRRTDLAVAAAGPATAKPGAELLYELRLTASGPSTAGAALVAELPAGASFVSVAATSGVPVTCTTPAAGKRGTVRCAGSFPAGRAATVRLVLRHVSGDAVALPVSRTADAVTDPDAGNDTATTSTSIVRPQTPGGGTTTTPGTTTTTTTTTETPGTTGTTGTPGTSGTPTTPAAPEATGTTTTPGTPVTPTPSPSNRPPAPAPVAVVCQVRRLTAPGTVRSAVLRTARGKQVRGRVTRKGRTAQVRLCGLARGTYRLRITYRKAGRTKTTTRRLVVR